jgi:hypothetical protein
MPRLCRLTATKTCLSNVNALAALTASVCVYATAGAAQARASSGHAAGAGRAHPGAARTKCVAAKRSRDARPPLDLSLERA